MPNLKELFTAPLCKGATLFFFLAYAITVIHILLSVLLWAKVAFFTAFFQRHFIDATTTLLFSTNLILAFTLLIDYQYKKEHDKS